MADITLIQSGLKACSERYAAISDDHRHYLHQTEDIDGVTPGSASEDDLSGYARQAMRDKPQVVAAARAINGMAGGALERLAESLQQSYDIYRYAERENVEMITKSRAAWGGFGQYEEHTPGPGPRGYKPPVGRTDWSHIDIADTANIGDPLPTGDHAWDELEMAMASANLDYSAGMPDWLGGLIDSIFAVGPVLDSLQDSKSSWLPVYQLGEGLRREGKGYELTAVCLEHDVEVLRSNWDGSAHERAEAVLLRLKTWLRETGKSMESVGGDTADMAIEAVALQKQLVYMVQALLGAIPGIGTGLTAYQSAWTSAANAKEFWRKKSLMGAVEYALKELINRCVTFVNLVIDLLGPILALWSIVQMCWHSAQFDAKNGRHTLDIPKPI